MRAFCVERYAGLDVRAFCVERYAGLGVRAFCVERYAGLGVRAFCVERYAGLHTSPHRTHAHTLNVTLPHHHIDFLLFTFLTNFKISDFNKERTSSLKMI